MPILMKEQLEAYGFSYEELLLAYQDLTARLGWFYSAGIFGKYLPNMKNIQKHIKAERRKIKTDVLMKSIRNEQGIIDIVNPKDSIKSKVNLAELASFAPAFETWKIFLNRKIEEFTKAYVDLNLSRFKDADIKTLSAEYARMDLVDTTRNLYLLRLLGLMPVKQEPSQLLSVGAASGYREYYATHNTPSVDARPANDQLMVKFECPHVCPTHTALIDSDPFWQDVYRQYNMKQNDSMFAVNDDLYSALELLDDKIGSGELQRRNMISLWRMEHKALPDVDRFVELLRAVADDRADLVITIGAGNTDDEFNDRRGKLEEIHHCLSDRGLKPTRLLMHSGDRMSPVFGCFRYTSHELLHCSMNR